MRFKARLHVVATLDSTIRRIAQDAIDMDFTNEQQLVVDPVQQPALDL